MGTNFYAVDDSNACPACGHGVEDLHLGKRSAGWNYMLRLHPELGLDSLNCVEQYILDHNLQIYDEYGEPISVEDWYNMVITWHEGKWTETTQEFC